MISLLQTFSHNFHFKYPLFKSFRILNINPASASIEQFYQTSAAQRRTVIPKSIALTTNQPPKKESDILTATLQLIDLV